MELHDVEFVARLLALPLVMTIDPFAPLLVFGLCLRAGWVTDPVLAGPAFSGFAAPEFLVIMGALYVVHALADKVPVIAHLSDGVGIVAKPLAGALAGLWITHKLDPGSTLHWYALAVVLFGGLPAAAGLQLARTKVRLATSAVSLGTLHPLVSTLETVVALPLAYLAIQRPELALLIIVLVVAPLLWVCLKLIGMLVRAGRGVARRAGLGPSPMGRADVYSRHSVR